MTAKYDLLVVNTKKIRKSLANNFSSGVLGVTMPSWETKELPKNEWKDTEGEDVYIPPDGLHFGGADFEVKLCYKGTEGSWTHTEIVMLNYLRSSFLAVYCSYAEEGWGACYFTGISDIDIFSDPVAGDIVEYTLKFHLTKYERMYEDFYTYIVDDSGNLITDDKGNNIITDKI